MAKSGGRSGGRALVPKDDTVLNPVIRDEAGRFIVGAGRWAQNKFADLMISNWRNIEVEMLIQDHLNYTKISIDVKLKIKELKDLEII
jgi:hypothetical protein